MENRDIEGLQKLTKEYSLAARWMSYMVSGTLLMGFGLTTYFKIYNIGVVMAFIIIVPIWSLFSVSLIRGVMRRSLGYVAEKKEKTPWWHDALLYVAFLSVPAFASLSKRGTPSVIVIFLILGLFLLIVGLMNRKKGAYYSIFFLAGLSCTVFGITLIGFLKHIFYTHEMADTATWLISIGLGFVILGIILFSDYKKIIRKVKSA